MIIEINLKIILVIILVIILFFLIKNLNTYIIFIVFILIHELAHLLLGIVLGGKAKKIEIMPFGISLEIYFEEKRCISKILFFAIGPLINLIIAIIFLNSKIIYRDEIFYTNIALGIFNLLPILPLDGGKILKEIMKFIYDDIKAQKIALLISRMVLILLVFIYSMLLLKFKNLSIIVLLAYLWYLLDIEEKKYKLYEKITNNIKKYS